jgi:hypothetical protein
LITEFVRNNCVPGGVIVNGIKISTTGNCRIKLERVLNYNREQRANLTAKQKNGKVIQNGETFDVIYWDEKAIKYLYKPKVEVSYFLNTNMYGKVVKDIEKLLNDVYQTLELSESDNTN